jgi:hypothetical protein
MKQTPYVQYEMGVLSQKPAIKSLDGQARLVTIKAVSDCRSVSNLTSNEQLKSEGGTVGVKVEGNFDKAR